MHRRRHVRVKSDNIFVASMDCTELYQYRDLLWDGSIPGWGHEFFYSPLVKTASCIHLTPTQSAKLLGAVSQRINSRSMTLISHLHLLPSLEIVQRYLPSLIVFTSGAYPQGPSPICGPAVGQHCLHYITEFGPRACRKFLIQNFFLLNTTLKAFGN
jgi:hypothetical protein